MRLLIGDIGGTNARLVMYEADDDTVALRDSQAISLHKVVSQMYYKNNDFNSFSQVLCSFLALPGNSNIKVHSCCFAVAGPVTGNHINFTNREGWIIDGKSIQTEYDIGRVQLINDFVANGYGLLSLSKKELVTLQEGQPDPASDRPIALLGAGTGLGECFLTPNGDGNLTAYPTEGGHVEFAPRTPLESELLSYLQSHLTPSSNPAQNDDEMLPRVSVERVVSGKGLENIYEFLRGKYPDQVNNSFDSDYEESNEPGRLIGSEKHNYKLFGRALDIMFAVFGGEAGNVALKYLPYGGIYIAGGIAPKNIEFLTNQDSEFMRRFLDKGRMSSIMKGFPVHVVLKEDLGLRGAHIVASRIAADLVIAETDGDNLMPRTIQTATPGLHSGANENNPQNSNVLRDTRLFGAARNVEDRMSISEAVRHAILDYPITYAFVTSTTAAVTAAAVVGTLHVMRRAF